MLCSKNFWCCGPSVFVTSTQLAFVVCSHEKYVNEGAWLGSNKLYLQTLRFHLLFMCWCYFSFDFSQPFQNVETILGLQDMRVGHVWLTLLETRIPSIWKYYFISEHHIYVHGDPIIRVLLVTSGFAAKYGAGCWRFSSFSWGQLYTQSGTLLEDKAMG